MNHPLNYSSLWLLLIPTLLCPPLWLYLMRRERGGAATPAIPPTLPSPWMDGLFRRRAVLACLTPAERATLDAAGRRAVISQVYCALLCEDPQDGSSLDMDVLDAVSRQATDYRTVPGCVGREAHPDAIRRMAATEVARVTQGEFYSRALSPSRRVKMLREVVRVFFADAEIDSRLAAVQAAVCAKEGVAEAVA